MKIQPTTGKVYAPIVSVTPPKLYGVIGKTAYTRQSSKADEVSFSKEGLTFSRALNAAKEAAGVTAPAEQSRVLEVKQQIADGNYKINSKLVAGSILDSIA
jgi:flagellar biosynthesis anti-sigma factor FlgM